MEEPEDKKTSAFKKLNSSGGVINIDDQPTGKFKKLKSSGGTINLDDQSTAKFKNLKSSSGTINLDKDESKVKRRIRAKSTDVDKIFKPPEDPPVKRRLRAKSTDVEKIFKPPEEPPAKKRDASTKPDIKVVPVKPAVEEIYMGEKINLDDRRKSYWAKRSIGELEYALRKFQIPKVITVKIKGEFVKKEVDKINKKTMLAMIFEKQGIS